MDAPTTAVATNRAPLPRAAVVWPAFAIAAAVTVGLLWLAAPARGPVLRASVPAPLPNLAAEMRSPAAAPPRIAPRDLPIARGRWRAIVIHDSGTPAGDLASIERRHLDAGLSGLGYHFVIGNGQGLEDGQVAVGYRWERQLPGAHATTAMRTPRPLRGERVLLDGDALNRMSIGVCLVGNAERRPFTERQLRELAALVRALQAELGIGAESVFFRSELVPGAPTGSLAWASAVRAELLP